MRKLKFNITKESIILIIIGAIIYSIAIKWFLQPSGLYTSGVTGISLILSSLLIDKFNVNIPFSVFLLGLNLPLIYVSWKHVGRTFTIYSFLSVFTVSVLTQLIPEQLITYDKIMSAVYGGTLIGIGVGLTLKAGGSTGGTDIISLLMSYKSDKPMGQYALMVNGSIIILASLLFGWEIGLYTLINVYISSMFIDKIHTRYKKITLNIITSHPDDLVSAIHRRVKHGITRINATGAYSKQHREILYMVISSYELKAVKQAIDEVDAGAFVNITDSMEILGNFKTHKIS